MKETPPTPNFENIDSPVFVPKERYFTDRTTLVCPATPMKSPSKPLAPSKSASKLMTPLVSAPSTPLVFSTPPPPMGLTFLNSLGRGAFSEVYRVAKPDASISAVKVLTKPIQNTEDLRRRFKEIAHLQKVEGSPHCLKYLSHWIAPWGPERCECVFIQTELCKGTLQEKIADEGHLLMHQEFLLWSYLEQIALGLKAIHDKQLIHLDIKPANLFFGDDGRMKIGDFGLVTQIGEEFEEGDSVYMAPELFNTRRMASSEADIFSLGVTMFELATDFQLPRDGIKWHRLREDVLTVDGLLKQRNPDLSPDLRGLIAHMMAPMPARRPKLESIIYIAREKVSSLHPHQHQFPLQSQSSVKSFCTVTPQRPPPTPTPPSSHHHTHPYFQTQTPVPIPQTPSRFPLHVASGSSYPLTSTPYLGSNIMTPISSSRLNSARSLRSPTKTRRGEVEPDLLESLQPARKLFSQFS